MLARPAIELIGICIVVALAVSHSGMALLGFFLMFGTTQWDSGVHGFLAIQLVAFLLSALLLLGNGFKDKRTLYFGVLALLSAAAFSKSGVGYLANIHDYVAVRLIASVSIDALFPYYFWKFVNGFPRAFVSARMQICTRSAIAGSLVVGLGLIVANILGEVYSANRFIELLDNRNPTGAYSILTYGLAVPALVLFWHKSRKAAELERRRVRVFTAGLLVSLIPPLLFILITSLSASATNFVLREDVSKYVFPMMQAFLLAAPILTTYAVLVEQILPVRILLRQTARYSLGYGFLGLAIAFPVILASFYLFQLRSLSLADLFTDASSIFLLLAVAPSVAIYLRRRRALVYLDKMFYRASYDTNSVLSGLSSDVADMEDKDKIFSRAKVSISESLFPESLYFLLCHNQTYMVDPDSELRPMTLSQSDSTKLMSLPPVVFINELRQAVSAEALEWFEEANTNILVVLKGSESLLGLVMLGRKKSELNYVERDLDFLRLFGNLMTIPLGRMNLSAPTSSSSFEAFQCQQCAWVSSSGLECENCSSSLFVACLLPKVLHSRYEVKQMIHTGGMGVIYKAFAAILQRPVVLKTCVSASSEEIQFLRDEARTMANLNHANIATIFGYESYGGIPILVCEYLENGTLEDAIGDASLNRDEAMDVLLRIAEALGYLHRNGIAHGDVKPSNVGFDSNDVPKLLDFGLSKKFAGLNVEEQETASTVGGTYPYFSPERMKGGEINQFSDLWALSVMSVEVLFGLNPFCGESVAEIIDKQNRIDSNREEFSEDVQMFCQLFLASDISRRPQNSASFAHNLRSFKFGSFDERGKS